MDRRPVVFLELASGEKDQAVRLLPCVYLSFRQGNRRKRTSHRGGTMLQCTMTIEQLKDMLKFDSTTGATGTDPLLKTAKVGLYVNNISPTPGTVFADLTEASWTGYARSGTVTWSAAVVSNETNLPAIVGDSKTFTVTTQPTPAQVAFGYFIATTVSAVDHLLAVVPFDTPLQPGNGSEILVTPRLGVNDQAVNPSGDLSFE